jgi:hypothetical protein
MHHEVEQPRHFGLEGELPLLARLRLLSRVDSHRHLVRSLDMERKIARFELAGKDKKKAGRKTGPLPSTFDSKTRKEMARSERRPRGGWGAEIPKPLHWTGPRGNDAHHTFLWGVA